jgi:hypothetical protein
MAIRLQIKPNVLAPVFPFSYGRIKDNPGDNTGTPVNEYVYGDFHQFFAALLSAGSITPNDLPENGSNGYQYNQALYNITNLQTDFFHIVGSNFLEPPFQNSFATSTLGGSGGVGYKKCLKTNRVFFKGAFQRATEANTTVAFTLPVAYRPLSTRITPIFMLNNSVYVPGIFIVETNGNCYVSCNAGDGVSLATYIVDGLSFDLD